VGCCKAGLRHATAPSLQIPASPTVLADLAVISGLVFLQFLAISGSESGLFNGLRGLMAGKIVSRLLHHLSDQTRRLFDVAKVQDLSLRLSFRTEYDTDSGFQQEIVQKIYSARMEPPTAICGTVETPRARLRQRFMSKAGRRKPPQPRRRP
jgi:hypothetical protein